MSMLSQLKALWGHQGRIKHLEACNLAVVELLDEANTRARQLRRDLANTAARAEQAIAERDATAISLEETTASLIDAKRQHGKLNEEFDRLAGMFRKKIDDLAAAEELLDEAGESIRIWRKVAFEMVAKLVVEKHCR